MTTATTTATTQVHRIYINAKPEAVWDAITSPEWNGRYGYGARAEYDLRPGGAHRAYASAEMIEAGKQMGFETPEVIVDGEVIECDPPHRLVQTWRMLMDPGTAEEGFTRLTYEIDEVPSGVTRLTVIHDLAHAPKTAQMVSGSDEAGAGGGWAWVLSDLKTLLETGKAFAG